MGGLSWGASCSSVWGGGPGEPLSPGVVGRCFSIARAGACCLLHGRRNAILARVSTRIERALAAISCRRLVGGGSVLPARLVWCGLVGRLCCGRSVRLVVGGLLGLLPDDDLLVVICSNAESTLLQWVPRADVHRLVFLRCCRASSSSSCRRASCRCRLSSRSIRFAGLSLGTHLHPRRMNCCPMPPLLRTLGFMGFP